MRSNKSHLGFTLIELMVALALGLLVIAAGLALFLNAQKTSNFQAGMSDVQQNSNFGLSMLTHDLRHANLNTPSSYKINNKVVGSGIVFSASNLPSAVSAGTDVKYFTIQGKAPDATNAAVDHQSDQITIQFKPDVRGANQFDCEGTQIVANRTYVYRYYLDKLPNNQQIPGSLDRYGLYCDSGYYTDSSTSVQNIGAGGQLVLQNVDAFKIRFLVKEASTGHLRYMTINDYLGSMPATVTSESNYNNIGAIELGLLVTSAQSIGADQPLNTKMTYTIAGQTVTLKNNVNNGKYLRQDITQVVGIRNTLGAF